MARFRRGSFAIPRSSRRTSSWAFGPQSGTDGASLGVSATGAQIGGIAVAPTLEGLTLVRTRGEFLFILKTASAAGSGFFGAFGIGRATSAAVTAGIASVPSPTTEETWDGWLYHRYFSITSAGVIDGSVSADTDNLLPLAGVLRLEVDSKAMRKLDQETSTYCAIEVTESGTATGSWFFNSRQLIKLP